MGKLLCPTIWQCFCNSKDLNQSICPEDINMKEECLICGAPSAEAGDGPH